MTSNPSLQITWIPAETWREEEDAHASWWRPWVERRRKRRSVGVSHPVEDFLWDYYSVRGGRLMRWCPGPGRGLVGAVEEDFPDRDGYRQHGNGRLFDPGAWSEKRGDGLRWILNLQRTLRDREPVFGCLGLHEWAMVYEVADVRHPQLPLRLPHAEIRSVVESLPMCCTHFDAFRFFSRSARPLNQWQLTPENRVAMEQPGCLHANMDLFKWCLKLFPLVPSDITREAFDLALRARWMDMRASPYDVSGFDVTPIAIETAEGRREYGVLQRGIAGDAVPVRNRLIAVLERAVEESRIPL